jgi:hypothetical protein
MLSFTWLLLHNKTDLHYYIIVIIVNKVMLHVKFFYELMGLFPATNLNTMKQNLIVIALN